MRELRFYAWIVPYLGVFMCLVALITPAAFFENVFWNHQIITWIWGIYQDTFNSIVTSGFYEYPLQILSSIIVSSIVLISCLTVALSLIKQRNDLKKGKINILTYFIPAFSIIISTIIWMLMMEIAEQNLYDLSMWGRYIPGFGVIGLFIGASLIIIGSLVTKFIKAR